MLDASTEQAFSDDLVDPQAGWKVHISVPKYPPLFYGCDGVSLHPHMQESTLQRRNTPLIVPLCCQVLIHKLPGRLRWGCKQPHYYQHKLEPAKRCMLMGV